MKKYFVWSIVVLLSVFSVNAQYKMHVNMKNGSTIDVFVSEIENITWDLEGEETTKPENDGKAVISAFIENEYNSTRTALKGDNTSGYDVVWSTGDQFAVGGQIFTLESGEGTTKGTFTGPLPADNEYTAYYPSNYDGTTWPSYQTYTENNIMGLPMTASVTIKDGKVPASVNFTYVGGILRLTMRNDSEGKSRSVKSITVLAQELSDPITLDCGTGVALTSEGVPFHIAMPAINYSDVTIQIMDTNGAVCVKHLKGKTLDITRSTITTASFAVLSFVAHEYVDLGLSVKWATCNVGASSPEEYGDYYAWGETETKSNYAWSTYKWCNDGRHNKQTKYCTRSNYGTVDDKTVLDPEDDVAHVKWGRSWRMPTDLEMAELRENCIWTWTTLEGKNGYKVTSKKNGNSIFLPAAGCRSSYSIVDADSYGYYWSSSLDTGSPYYAWSVYFNLDNVDWGYVVWSNNYSSRFYGLSVRPVCP